MVVHADPWWNAAAQEQATDRAHRIGQTQDVNVYQIVAKDRSRSVSSKCSSPRATWPTVSSTRPAPAPPPASQN
ncbi:C-terminal helicase domain-containing protein [Bifidobacterium sp. ESL0769]|uniref:C-terminal helicase domain-containing protein n=1 Tax=Bifidobacterium sp. ESL0769 TaxID=2983229 RepID=UPI0023F8F4F6|nr:C-terminal helicase domain-containing protein [Bifidobacterium sp. ESL0769]WEV67937.1 C-terminal helicase domain-containing protein [Bifidobacterium sp. ESL0769]